MPNFFLQLSARVNPLLFKLIGFIGFMWLFAFLNVCFGFEAVPVFTAEEFLADPESASKASEEAIKVWYEIEQGSFFNYWAVWTLGGLATVAGIAARVPSVWQPLAVIAAKFLTPLSERVAKDNKDKLANVAKKFSEALDQVESTSAGQKIKADLENKLSEDEKAILSAYRDTLGKEG